MKKIAVLFAFLFVLVGTFGAIPATAAAVEDTLKVDYARYRIPRGTNLTWLARDFGTTKEKLLALNPPGSRCVKSTDLILAGCSMTLPIVSEDSHELGVARVDARAYKEGYKDGLQEGKQTILPGFAMVVVSVIGLLIVIVVLVRLLVIRTRRVAELEEKYGNASADLKESDVEKGRLCEQIEWLRNSNLQHGQRVQELVREKDKLCTDLEELGAANRYLNVQADELSREKERLNAQLKVAYGYYEALADSVRNYLTAAGLYELVQGMTVGELIKFLDEPTFGDDEQRKKALKKAKEFLSDQKLSVADDEMVRSLTLKGFLAYLRRGRVREI